MKKAILIVLVLTSVLSVPSAHAAEPSWTILLVGGAGADNFRIGLRTDGRTYEIESVAPLEVGGNVCWHPDGDPLKLLCDAPAIAAFEVNGEAGDDTIEISSTVRVPVTLMGGGGGDRLLAGTGDDKLTGGPGDDRLVGGVGNDESFGGLGRDSLTGGAGDDRLVGESGEDRVYGGEGNDILAGSDGRDTLGGGAGNDWLNGGLDRDTANGGPGNDRFVGGPEDDLSGGPGRDVVLPGSVVI